MPKDKSQEKRAKREDAPYERHQKGKKEGRSGRKHGGGDDASPVSSFDDMNLKPDLLKGIYAYGFEKPSAIQQRAIRPIVRGRDVIAQSQSGTGKTAVFAISALQLLNETSRDVQVLILSPTRELAEQSQRVVQSLGDFMNVRNAGRAPTDWFLLEGVCSLTIFLLMVYAERSIVMHVSAASRWGAT